MMLLLLLKCCTTANANYAIITMIAAALVHGLSEKVFAFSKRRILQKHIEQEVGRRMTDACRLE